MSDRLATRLGIDPERVARLQGLAPPAERRAPLVESVAAGGDAGDDDDRYDTEDPTLTVTDQRLVEAVATAWEVEPGALEDAVANVLHARGGEAAHDGLADDLGLDAQRVRDLQSGSRGAAA